MSTHDPKAFYNEVMPGKFGKDYEYERWHKNAIQEAGYVMTRDAIVRHVLGKDERQPIRVIELGPGAGTWSRMLLGRFPDAEFTLIDISSEMLDRAKHTLDALGERIHVHYVESDILEYADARQCDLFFSSRVLEYIPNKKAFAEKVAELLAPGGKGFVITKMPHYERDELLGRRAARFHTGQIQPHALAGLFEESGLVVTGVYPVTISIPLFHSAKLNALFGKLLARKPLSRFSGFFSESYCVIVEKA